MTNATTSTINDGMKVLLMAGLQEGLDELGYDAFVATLKERAADKAYVGGTPENGWQTSWITFSADKKTIKDIDLDGYYYYVALGQSLKPGIAFTNQGVTSYDGLFFNENNLFGLDGEAYGYNLKEVYELSNLPDTYGTWEQYWETHGDLIEKQMRMVDSIAYLVDAEDGDTAPYWYVRHGSNDRDTSFANQTLLYYALLNEKSIKTIDFKFAFDRGHEGSYDIVDADTFMTKSIGGKAYRPVIDNASDLKPGETSPQTGAASGMLPMVIASIAAVAGASVRGRKIR